MLNFQAWWTGLSNWWLGFLLSFLAMFGIAGCSTQQVNEIDTNKVMKLVLALGASGFDGDFSAEANGELEFYLIEGIGARSPGTHVKIRGHMNPDNVTPETVAAYLKAMEALEDESDGVEPGDTD